MKVKRPVPPQALQFGSEWFRPAPELDEFVRATFLDSASKLYIEQHEILREARFGYLWAFPPARDRGRDIIGTAQLIRAPQNKWSSLRAFDQVYRWFGQIDFLITVSATYCAEHASDDEFLALIDHELCHCCQDHRDGMPLFTREGTPIWGKQGHDVEQFVGVVERWGADAAGVRELVRAAQRKPRFGTVDINRVVDGCGTCRMAA